MTHLPTCPPPAPPPPPMPSSYGGSSAAVSAPSGSFPLLIADFQRSLHSRLLSFVHHVSTSATTASPLSVHQWLQEQLVACLDAEKHYILHSPPPPSLPPPPVSAAAMLTAPPAMSAPQQLSNALNELTLSATEAMNNAARQRQQMQQQQQQAERQARRDEEHRVSDVSDTEGAEDRATNIYRSTATALRRNSVSRSHLRPHHHHHHGHAVEVSVRCLPNPSPTPLTAAAYPRPHSHDDDDESSNSRIAPSAYSHTASTSYTLSTAVSTKREREEVDAGTTRSASPPCCSPPSHSSFLSPLPCLPNCNLPPLSPCSSSSPCLDFNCLDPTPFSLCDDDPLCCFPSFSPTDEGAGAAAAQHNGTMLDGDGTTEYTESGDALCSSPLSSVCLPMPCDPCAVTTASTTTTTTTTTLLSCVPCEDANCGDDDSSTASHNHSPTKLDDDDEDKQAMTRPLSPSNNPADSVDHSSISADTKVQTTSTPSTPRASSGSSAAAASSSLMVSCHQCKLKKPSTQCMQCTCNEQKSGGGKKRCVKKYCTVCLAKHYNFQMPVKVEGAEQADWICPACKGACSCAACARRKLMDEEEANMVSAFHHHHTHAHVTIHSLPHHHHSHPSHGHAIPPPAMPSLRASCHQCKSSKSSLHLLACSSRRALTADGKRLRDCKKKFCAVCLERWYGLDMEEIKRKEREGGPGWRCPACEGICPCAACRRKGGRKREDGKDDEEETVDGSDDEDDADRRAKRGRFVHHHHLHTHGHMPHHHHHSHGHAHSHPHSHPHHLHHNHMRVLPAAALPSPSSDVSAASDSASAAHFASTAVSDTVGRGDSSSVDAQWDSGWAADGGKPWVDGSGPPPLRNRA